jgi:hypothetical protein
VTFAWNMGLATLTTLAALIYGAQTMPVVAEALLLHRATEALELAIPLGCAISCAHLPTIDREERTLELRFSYAVGRWTLIAERLLPAICLLLLDALVGWAVLRRPVPSLTLTTTLVTVVPPTLGLLAVAWVGGVATGNAWVAAGGPLLWWGVALAAPRRAATGWLRRSALSFHLFQTARSVSGIDYGLNRWLLIGLGIALIALAGFLLQRHQAQSA